MSQGPRHDIIKHFTFLLNIVSNNCISSQSLDINNYLLYIILLPPHFYHYCSVELVKGKYYKLIQALLLLELESYPVKEY